MMVLRISKMCSKKVMSLISLHIEITIKVATSYKIVSSRKIN